MLKRISKKQKQTISTDVVYVGIKASGKYEDYAQTDVIASTYYPQALSELKKAAYDHEDTSRSKWISVYKNGIRIAYLDVEEINVED